MDNQYKDISYLGLSLEMKAMKQRLRAKERARKKEKSEYWDLDEPLMERKPNKPSALKY